MYYGPAEQRRERVGSLRRDGAAVSEAGAGEAVGGEERAPKLRRKYIEGNVNLLPEMRNVIV